MKAMWPCPAGRHVQGDRSRKNILVEHGFRLPSALDNRPLKFHEFMERQNQIVYASATPGPFELVNCRADNKTYIPVRRAARSGEKAPEGFKGILFTSPRISASLPARLRNRWRSLIPRSVPHP